MNPQPHLHDPFAASEMLQREYLGYLRDALPIHPSQPALGSLIDEKINQPDAFAREPMISAIPAWQSAQTPLQLIGSDKAPRFHPAMADIFGNDIRRPLYAHQVQAVERIQSGRNLVVATGTGSGKTECFLLPLVDEALRSNEPVGVEAIFIYPMNALAHDQLGRMQEMLGGSSVTFGRYTGQTSRDELPADSPERVCTNERVTRPEIREQPPQLLLTNFAMLEYLLLRPDDQKIFAHNRVHTIVLDEAHSYRGAQGIDISLLMRRLRHRFGSKLRFILTSATIGDEGGDSSSRIAEFASRLTGADFDAADVIRGTPTSPFREEALHPIPAEILDQVNNVFDHSKIEELLGEMGQARAWGQAMGLPETSGEQPRNVIFEVLSQLEPMADLYRKVVKQPSTSSELAEYLSKRGHSLTAQGIRWLLLLAANAQSPKNSVQLFSARVHHFFRGLQGASVVLKNGGSDLSESDGIVEEVVMQEDASADNSSSKKWPLYVCHACGMPAISAREDNHGDYIPAHPAASDDFTLLTWMPPSQLEDGLDEEDTDESQAAAKSAFLYKVPGVDANGQLSKCPCCGARAGQFDSVMRRFATGEDAPTAVLAEELLRRLPSDPEKMDFPAEGRKLLAFSDSRQRAAFFAPYLSRTIAEASFVQPLIRVIQEAEKESEPCALSELASLAQSVAIENPWVIFRECDEEGVVSYQIKASDHLSSIERKALRKEFAVTAYKHLSARPAQRNRMLALMIAAPEIDITGVMRKSIDTELEALLPDTAIRQDLVQRLLFIMLRRYAVNFGRSGIDRRHLIGGKLQGPTVAAFHRDPPGGKPKGGQPIVSRWNPFLAAANRRKNSVRKSHQAEQVRKALKCMSLDAANDQLVSDVLGKLWDVLIDPNSGLLEDMDGGRFRLDSGHVLVRQAGPWFRCDRCDARTRTRMGDACEVFGCTGILTPVDDPAGERSQSRLVQRYSRDPLPVNVREHTAQLSFDKARQYQMEFTAGKVNVLSCSTTFEMGVDVGSLDTVFLRNVPRSTANYVQRVGRAGRRNQSLAHAVTYAHATPHDQYHYFKPTEIAAGRVPVPVVYTANPILAQRHVNAYLLGRFWPTIPKPSADKAKSWRVANPEGDNGFFSTDSQDANCPAARFSSWCSKHEQELAEALDAMLNLDELGIGGPEMVRESKHQLIGGRDSKADVESVWSRGLLLPWSRYQAQAKEREDAVDQAASDKDYGKAKKLQSQAARARKIATELCSEQLIGFLSSNHWLPNYAFPQDSVRLLVRQDTKRDSLRLERPRAMGIIDYAPGAEVIVDGQLIKSTAIELEKRTPQLGYFQELKEGRVQLFPPGATDIPKGPNTHAYIEPRGFSTNINDLIVRPNLFRKRPAPNTPVFLVNSALDEEFESNAEIPVVLTALRKSSTLFTANLGPRGRGGRANQGYRLCLSCGSQVAIGARNGHVASWGSPCRGRYEQVALANRFETTVLQIRFQNPLTPLVASDESFWKTLATGLGIAAAELLDIERGDLRVDFRSREDATQGGELFAYDNIPGGAGYAQRIQERLPDVLKRTHERLNRCENSDCRPESSCYACLRSYENQYQWPLLQRNAPLEWLNLILGSAT